MKANIQEAGSNRIYVNSTIKNTIVRLFRRFPILTNEAIFRIITILLMLPLVVLLNRWKGECTCEDQIQDQRLVSTTYKQDKQVQAYLKTRDNPVMCEARRQELLKKLEEQKKLKAKHTKS